MPWYNVVRTAGNVGTATFPSATGSLTFVTAQLVSLADIAVLFVSIIYCVEGEGA